MTTNYERQDVAQPGQVYDTSNNLIISVKNNNDTLQFGDFVVNDSGNIVKWNSDDYAEKKPIGVVLYNALEIQNVPSINSKIPIISRGTVWLSVDETDPGFANVKKGNTAYLSTVNGEPTGFIDDVITNQKIGVFVEDPSELNESGYLVPIELKLFANNLRNMIVVESYPNDPASSESTDGEIYYNSTDDVLKTYIDDNWETIVTTPDTKGHYVVKNSSDIAPSDINGEIYYDSNNNVFRVYENSITKTVVTTSDAEGNYVVKSNLDDPSNPIDGEIYYSTANNVFRVRKPSQWNTIVTTPSSIGNYIVTHTSMDHAFGENGEIYYNTTDNAFRSYTQGGWSYLSPKPYFHYSHDPSGDLSTSLPSDNEYIAIDYLSDDDIDYSFLFSRTPSTFPNSNTSNGIEFTGIYPIRCQVLITISGHTSDSNDTVIEFKVENQNSDSFTGGKWYLNLQDSDRSNTTHIAFTALLNRRDQILLYAKHDSSSGSIDLTLDHVSILCQAI